MYSKRAKKLERCQSDLMAKLAGAGRRRGEPGVACRPQCEFVAIGVASERLTYASASRPPVRSVGPHDPTCCRLRRGDAPPHDARPRTLGPLTSVPSIAVAASARIGFVANAAKVNARPYL